MNAPLRANKSGNTTARKAAQILVAKNIGYTIPTARQKKNLVIAFAKQDMIVYGKAFDILHLKERINLDSLEDVESHLDGKSTNQKFEDDFRGYFFALTAAE